MEQPQPDEPVDGCCLGCLAAPVLFLILSALFGPLIGLLGTLLILPMISAPDAEVDPRDPP
jgi:tetrahydromethanopterin S-methyltransferase subunit C